MWGSSFKGPSVVSMQGVEAARYTRGGGVRCVRRGVPRYVTRDRGRGTLRPVRIARGSAILLVIVGARRR